MTDLVGRHELAVLSGHLDDAIAGHGSLVLVAGKPRVGKTALADRATSDARDLGALALWGRCVAGESSPPFAPWIQVIRAWLESASGPAGLEAVAEAAPDRSVPSAEPASTPTSWLHPAIRLVTGG